MAQIFEVHPDNPQARFLRQAAQILSQGGIGAIPTDSSYALVCQLDDKAAAVTDRPVSPPDLQATVLHLLGVNPASVIHDRQGRPHHVSDGQVIRGL